MAPSRVVKPPRVAKSPIALECVDLVLVMNNGRMQHPVGPKDAVLAKALQRPAAPRPLKVVPDLGGSPA